MSDAARPEKQQPTTVDSFASGLRDSISSPFNGGAELLGGPRSTRAAGNEDHSAARGAGEMLGSALVFIATTAAVNRFLPGAGRFAPIVAGGVLGGLSETPNGTLAERLTNAAIGAGTVSLLEFAPVGLSKLGVQNKLGQLAVSNAGAGMFHAQADSFMKTGHAAGLSETMLAAATWTGTGLGFAGVGRFKFAGNRQTEVITPSAAENQSARFVEIPGLKLGEPASPTSKIEVPSQSELAKMYELVKPSIGRAEVLAYNPSGGMEGRFGTVFSLDTRGRLVTADHVTSGAVDVTVFDSNMRPHKASVLAANETADVAVLQLKDPKSFAAFPPLIVDNTHTAASGTSASTFGHPNGWRSLFASPGVEANSPRPGTQLRFQMHNAEGLSGAPIITDQGVKAVFVQGARSSAFDTYGTPIKHAQQLLEQADRIQAPAANDSQFAGVNARPPKLDLQLIQSFNIQDKAAASANLEKLFGANFSTELPPQFFHSKVKTVPLPGTESGALTMSMQYIPVENRVVISPIAIDKQAIPSGAKWPGSKLSMDHSRLEVHLSPDGTPVRMLSFDDPTGVLQQGFNYRGENNYLATLQQRTMSKWMQLLPARLRFERLAVGS